MATTNYEVRLLNAPSGMLSVQTLEDVRVEIRGFSIVFLNSDGWEEYIFPADLTFVERISKP